MNTGVIVPSLRESGTDSEANIALHKTVKVLTNVDPANETCSAVTPYTSGAYCAMCTTYVGFMAFTEWIGILSSDCSGHGHGPPAGLCDFGDGVSGISHGS